MKVNDILVISQVVSMGMPLVHWQFNSCVANIAVSDEEKWATVYDIASQHEGKGHATTLLTEAKKHYEKIGYKFGGSVALNERMRKIYDRLKIKEYN